MAEIVQRMLIIGPCGAGKSTLATRPGARLGLPVHHLDQLKWQPGWLGNSPFGTWNKTVHD